MKQGHHICELDGLRGIAVISVFLFHCSAIALSIHNSASVTAIKQMFSMGWVGVDLFFVLSGFLITSILLRTKEQPNYFRNFYGRRALRIFPIYYFLLLISFVVLIPLFDREHLSETLAHQGWFYLYLHNWIPAFYNGETSRYSAHLWSLAVEEQFYLVWPLCVFLLNRKVLLAIAVVIAVAVPIYRFHELDTFGLTIQEYVRFSTITRVDTLMMGSAIALAYSKIEKLNVAKFLSFVISAELLYIVFLILWSPQSLQWDTYDMMTIGYTIVGVFCGTIILSSLVMPANGRLRVVLRSPLLAFFGKYSYGIYIFHWPIVLLVADLFTKQNLHGKVAWVAYILICTTLTIMTAIISWHAFEKRFLDLKRWFA